MNQKGVFFLMENQALNISSSSTCSTTSAEIMSSSTDTTVSSTSDEDTDLLLPLMQYLMSGRKISRVDNYLQVVDSLSDIEFKCHFRLGRSVALQLIDELKESEFIPQHLHGVKPISAKLSLLLFLWYMANTEPLRTMSDRFDVSISSVFRRIRRVLKWLLTKMAGLIRWPEGHNVIVVSEKFRAKRDIPNILGAIDGTHIRIERPALNERDYCNRKKFHSINLQAVVDAEMRFTDIYAGEPGSLHDARVLRRSPLYQEASANKEVLFPNNTFIIGDSAYASLSWLVPPFRDNGHLSPQQTEFNFLHSSTRMVVEKAFGRLKGRFRRIKFFTEYRDITFIVQTVVAACILHNCCIEVNDEFDFPEFFDADIDNDNENNEAVHRGMPNDRRMQLFLEMFPDQRMLL